MDTFDEGGGSIKKLIQVAPVYGILIVSRYTKIYGKKIVGAESVLTLQLQNFVEAITLFCRCLQNANVDVCKQTVLLCL